MKKEYILTSALGVFSLLALSSCNDYQFHNTTDLSDPTYDNGSVTAVGLAYAEQFNGRTDTEINITSDIDPMFVNVFAEYPYDEESGEITVDPIIQGYTPLNDTVKLANHVNTLYVLTPFGVVESTSPRIELNYGAQDSSAPQTRAGSTVQDVDAVKSIVTYPKADFNKICSVIPEQTQNFTFEDLCKCSDIVIANDETQIWATFINDGNGNFMKEGLMWFYTYDASLTQPTIDDCTFYYYDQTAGAIKPLEGADSPYSTGNKSFKSVKGINKYLFYNWNEKDNIQKNDKYSRLYLGTFNKGVKIGFASIMNNGGNGDGNAIDKSTRMSTPCLSAVDQYMGKVCTLGPVISKPISNIMIFAVEDFDLPNSGVGNSTYLVGSENRLPVEGCYEPDYNDMVLLIETSHPINMVEEVQPQKQGTTEFLNGYYLFEDNYPSSGGDCDYNDVVVQYHIESNKSKQEEDPTRNKVTVRLMAKGCSFSNEFGFRVGDTYYPLIKGIKGYLNVDQGNTGALTDESDLETYSMTIPGSISFTQAKWFIRPYLFNGKYYVFNTTIKNVDYPYVLDVPAYCNGKNNLLDKTYVFDDYIGKKSQEFRWMREGNNILTGYRSIKTDFWYGTSNIKDRSKVVRRVLGDPMQ